MWPPERLMPPRLREAPTVKRLGLSKRRRHRRVFHLRFESSLFEWCASIATNTASEWETVSSIASRPTQTGFVLDALEQALHQGHPASSITATAAFVQYVSVKYTESLKDFGLEPSVGGVGDAYDNAFAEASNGLYKAEVIWRRGPWRLEQAEFATLE